MPEKQQQEDLARANASKEKLIANTANSTQNDIYAPENHIPEIDTEPNMAIVANDEAVPNEYMDAIDDVDLGEYEQREQGVERHENENIGIDASKENDTYDGYINLDSVKDIQETDDPFYLEYEDQGHGKNMLKFGLVAVLSLLIIGVLIVLFKAYYPSAKNKAPEQVQSTGEQISQRTDDLQSRLSAISKKKNKSNTAPTTSAQSAVEEAVKTPEQPIYKSDVGPNLANNISNETVGNEVGTLTHAEGLYAPPKTVHLSDDKAMIIQEGDLGENNSGRVIETAKSQANPAQEAINEDEAKEQLIRDLSAKAYNKLIEKIGNLEEQINELEEERKHQAQAIEEMSQSLAILGAQVKKNTPANSRIESAFNLKRKATVTVQGATSNRTIRIGKHGASTI